MRLKFFNLMASLLLIVLTACGSPSASTESKPAGNATPTQEAATPEEEEIRFPPADYVDVLNEKIASGEWSEEEGLIILLKLFAGETQDTSLEEGLLETEGFGILNLAVEYLQTGTDEAAKAEITRLLNLLVPSQDALDRYSIPAEQANRRPPGLAAPIRQEQECATLWAEGFPDTRTPSFPCFMYGDGVAAGQPFRVYYPLAWRGGERRVIYESTLDALAASLNTFQAYGTVRPIYVVFTTLNHSTGLTTLAITNWTHFRPGEACPVIVYPTSFSLTHEQFQQTIAHEVFHCFQTWNLRDQGIGAGYNSSKWWLEGTAEYFSNLVYPSVNFEYRFADSFSLRSNSEPLTAMDYENFIFFQYLGNRLGPAGVIAFLRQMPVAPGSEQQLAALAATPGMEDMWEEFARGVFDQAIVDSDGSIAAIRGSFSNTVPISGDLSVTLTGNPFVLARHRLVFSGEKQYAIVETSNGPGRSAARLSGMRGVWQPLPASVSSCFEEKYILYTLTTTPNSQRAVTVTSIVTGDLPCDRCVIGQWRSTPESVLGYFRSVIAQTGDGSASVYVEEVSGALIAEFREDGSAVAGYDNLVVHQTVTGSGVLGGPAIETDIFLQFNGTSSGRYSADGTHLTGFGPSTEIVVTVDTYVNNQFMGTNTMPIRPEDFPAGAPLPTRYTCSETTLTMWPPITGIPDVSPIEYRRVGR